MSVAARTTTIIEVTALLGTIKTAKLDSLGNFDLLSKKKLVLNN